MRNSNGFVYPLTLILLTLFLALLTVNINHLLTERKMFSETQNILLEEHYMLSASNKIEQSLRNETILSNSLVLPYNKGKVDVKIETLSPTQKKITFKILMDSGATFLAYGYYDVSLKKMVKWIELN